MALIKIHSIGKQHDKNIAPVIHDYEQRLKHYVRLDWNISPSAGIEQESNALLKKSNEGYRILLDERGSLIDTSRIMQTLERLQNHGPWPLHFLIGGAYGVNQEVHTQSSEVWSLSRLVLPHQFVRLLLVEQLYRSYNALEGGKYHHA
jgi:23S rRNA (pseudouridine1915-N3)-methyltransferase